MGIQVAYCININCKPVFIAFSFQTLYVEPGLCLCDCPGLVMPSFVSTKAEMICSGVLPIDQMRDHVPAVSLISFWEHLQNLAEV